MTDATTGTPPDLPDAHQLHVQTHLALNSQLLGAVLSELRSGVDEIAVSDSRKQEMVLDNWPVAGSRRVIVQRTGQGYDSLAVPQSAQPPVRSQVLPASTGRTGGTIVNSGAVPVVLYLADQPVPCAGAPAIYLAAGGGAWDFRLGNVLWCGTVSAVAIGGASTLTVAEV